MSPGLRPPELSSAQAEQVKSFIEPIKFNPDVIPSNRHPLTNLLFMPTNYGFLRGNGLFKSDEISCEDYSIRVFKDKPAGGKTTITTTINNSQIEVSDYQTQRIYHFNHQFNQPQIERLGDGDVANGVYFILDKGDINTIFYRIKDDINKTITGKSGGKHIEEEELEKSKVQVTDVGRINEIKRIGEYLMVIGSDRQDENKTRIVFINQDGKAVLSKQVGYRVDKIVTNQKADRENKFIFVTSDKKVVIEELTDKDGTLKFGGDNQFQAQNVGRAINYRNLIDVAILGDEIVLAVSGKSGKEVGKKMISIVAGDGKFQLTDQEVGDVTGVTYLDGLPYRLHKQGNDLNATLVTG